jgi:hypothetical protein
MALFTSSKRGILEKELTLFDHCPVLDGQSQIAQVINFS